MSGRSVSSWRQPLLTIAGMAVMIGLVERIDPVPGALILGAVLAMTFARSRLVASWQGRAEAVLLLPVIALATSGVASLLKHVPLAGAIAFVSAMFASIWLRRYGPTGSRIGGLLALPFITLLIVPGGGAGVTMWGAAGLSLIALAVVVSLRVLAESTGFLPRSPSPQFSAEPARASSLKPIASTRMALQMALALIAAFLLGWLAFPQHVTWVVLTAFLVCSGNRGRADVLHKSGLRILGAAAGTLVATRIGPSSLRGAELAVLLLAVIGVGLWLRTWSYAAWALAMTLVIALLQAVIHPAAAASGGVEIGERLLAILVGAVCGVGASWFVLPVRSEPVVRLRIANALARLDEYLVETSAENDRAVDEALHRLDEVAPPWRAWEPVGRWTRSARRPALWIVTVHDCVELARAQPDVIRRRRRDLGEARRAIREPATLTAALLTLRERFTAAEPGKVGP